MKKLLSFDYLYVAGFGWQNTILQEGDFATVEKIEEREDSVDYVAYQENGKSQILKINKL